MQIRYPFHVDDKGQTAGADSDAHVRNLIEQVLFTTPGERVNRPTFGSGILNLVFTPANEALGAATQQLVQSALQQWLGDLIQVEAVRVEREEAQLQVTVQYVLRRDRQRRVARLTREV